MRSLSRRRFLAEVGTVAAGGALVACGGGLAIPSASAAGATTTPSPVPSPIKVTLGSVSVSAANSAIWAAEDGGYLKKYGLDAVVKNIGDSTQAVPAMLSGEVPLNCGISGSAVVASSLQGGDVFFVGVTVNTFPSSLYVKQSVPSVAALKGGKIGVSRLGSASDTGGRIALTKNGLDAKDFTFVQLGGLDQILAALIAGQIDGAVLSPPQTLLARSAGFKDIVDMSTLGVEYVYNGIATTRAFAKDNGPAIEGALKAIVEGVHRFKTDAAFGKSVVANRTKLTDQGQVDETYRLFANTYLKDRPFLTDASFKTVLDELAPVQPKAVGANTAPFYDNGYLKKLEDSGFLKSVLGS